jgi:hypothetical protein
MRVNGDVGGFLGWLFWCSAYYYIDGLYTMVDFIVGYFVWFLNK